MGWFMKRIVSVVLRPLAQRIGAFVSGALAGYAVVDPVMLTRVEAWVAAGAGLLVDILVAKRIGKTQEGR